MYVLTDKSGDRKLCITRKIGRYIFKLTDSEGFSTCSFELLTKSHFDSGTSFSAPHVTGVLAQLIQKYSTTVNINNFITYFKARLMLGANSDIVTDMSHRIGDSNIFYDKKGAGFLDAVESASYIYGWNKRRQIRTLSDNYYVYIFTPPMDYSIKAVLVFEKPESILITSEYGNDFNLYLESPSGQVFTSSTSETNTFEMIEYTIPANQSILLRIEIESSILSGKYISYSCYWMGV